MAQLFHVGVKALCKNKQGKYLVLAVNPSHFARKAPAHWDIPGGRIEGDDALEDTLRREIKEELGIDYDGEPKFLVAVLSNIKLPHGDLDVRLAIVAYEVVLPEGENIKLDDENIKYEWVNAEVARERLSYKYPKEFTEKIL